jgi:hypothetical protein
MRLEFSHLLQAEISSVLSPFFHRSCAPELALRTMQCEGKVEPKGNVVKRKPPTVWREGDPGSKENDAVFGIAR